MLHFKQAKRPKLSPPKKKSREELRQRTWPHKLYRVGAVARALGVNSAGIHGYIKRGKLLARFPKGSQRYIYADEAAALILGRTVRKQEGADPTVGQARAKAPPGSLLRWSLTGKRQRIGHVKEYGEHLAYVGVGSGRVSDRIPTPAKLLDALASGEMRLESPVSLLESVAAHYTMRKQFRFAKLVKKLLTIITNSSSNSSSTNTNTTQEISHA